jgi:hypothetical protein
MELTKYEICGFNQLIPLFIDAKEKINNAWLKDIGQSESPTKRRLSLMGKVMPVSQDVPPFSILNNIISLSLVL